MKRILFGLLFALPFMLVTGVWAQAEAYDSSPISSTEPVLSDDDCETCHAEFHNSWQTSAHGMAADDPTFVKVWQEQGEPFECMACHTTGYDARWQTWDQVGVTCMACHGPYPEEHPKDPMPSDRSPELCGSCHQETLFEFSVSAHSQAQIDCVDCHGQHETNLRDEDASALCNNCHRERASSFAHTAHSEEGLTCADCHLAQLEGGIGNGHAYRDHSFYVKLSTCNECHEYQMHDSSQISIDESTIEPDAMAAVESAGVSLDPDPVDPFYFILLAALVGMAFGLLVAPWIERWYHRLTDINVDDEI